MNILFRQKRSGRPGAAVVELAVTLPILVALVVGTVEACEMIYLRSNLSIASYEGARIGILPGTTQDRIRGRCEMLLNDRGIEQYTIGMAPEGADFTSATAGDVLTVTVSSDCGANSTFGGKLYAGLRVSESMSMLFE